MGKGQIIKKLRLANSVLLFPPERQRCRAGVLHFFSSCCAFNARGASSQISLKTSTAVSSWIPNSLQTIAYAHPVEATAGSTERLSFISSFTIRFASDSIRAPVLFIASLFAFKSSFSSSPEIVPPVPEQRSAVFVVPSRREEQDLRAQPRPCGLQINGLIVRLRRLRVCDHPVSPCRELVPL